MQLFKSNRVKSAVIGIYSLLLTTIIVIGLYIGSAILIPIALAILLAFLLAPLVTRLERYLGRVLAVILVVMMMALVIGVISYILGRELIQFATNLPSYKTNINAIINSLQEYHKNIFQNSNQTINQFLKIPDVKDKTSTTTHDLFDYSKSVLNFVGFILDSFINIIITIALVILLVSFILIEREDLRGRFIRMLGQGRIGVTTSTINDASIRVAYYLRMFLFINIIYGLFVALGLYFLGIPNAFLWGALSTILRFVPYIGVWVAAAIPLALSLVIATTWFLPLIAVSWFVILEAATSNIFEPWLYGASTGVSATALIIAAIFWTFLWGPLGLVLSTPITVCLVVLGRHVPRLEFLSILLSDEKPLTIYEEYYHRLLVANIKEVISLTDDYLKIHSLSELYDQVLIPVIANVEIDIQKEKLDDEQAYLLHQNIEDMIEDLNVHIPVNKEETTAEEQIIIQKTEKRIVSIPAKAKRDELVGEMLTQLLKQKKYNIFNMPSALKTTKLLTFMKEKDPTLIIISVIAPSTIIQARYLARIMKSNFPHAKLMVGLWNYAERIDDVKEALLNSGIDEVVTTLADAISYVEHN